MTVFRYCDCKRDLVHRLNSSSGTRPPRLIAGARVRDEPDDSGEDGGWRRLEPQTVGVDQGVGRVEQRPEGLLVLAGRTGIALVDITPEQHVELPHPAPAAPAQPTQLLR